MRFVLRIAERTGAIVLSNDSFQEFHGEHPWLFDDGRLIGGKPVPGVGWIFTPRLPIRGPKSRAATADKRAKDDPGSSAPAKAAELARAAKKAAKRTSSRKRAAPTVSTSWPLIPSAPPPPPRGNRGRTLVDPDLSSAIDEAVAEALDPPKSVKVAKASKTAKAAKVAKGAKADKGAKAVKGPVKKKKAAAAKKDAAPKKAAATKKATAKSALTTSTATKKVTKKAVAKKAAATKKAPVVKKSAPEMKAEPVRKSAAKKSSAPQPDLHPAKRRVATPPPAVNEPLAFITFVATYPVGTILEGEVVSFTSHGAMVDVDLPDGGSLHCYIPLSAMGNPPPTKARQMLTKGEVRPFVLSSLDPPRRVAELSLPTPEAQPKRRQDSARKAAAARR